MSSLRTFSNRQPSQITPATTGTPAAGLPPPSPAGTGGRHRRPWYRRLRTRHYLGLAVPMAVLAAALMFITLAPLSSGHASAATTPHRLTALRWAERQAGKWYCWGGTGPSCFDCSGLAKAAYAHAGIRLPRTTSEMLASPKLRRIPASHRRRGDLAFYGRGHVELVTWHGTFGAATTGTRIWWHHPSRWWHPTMYFRVR